MKKYFMKGTDDELQFGEVIELDMVGKEKGKVKHTHLEVEFLPELVDELLEQEVIEERESDEEDDELINFSDDLDEIWDKLEKTDCVIEELQKQNKKILAEVEALEKLYKTLKKNEGKDSQRP